MSNGVVVSGAVEGLVDEAVLKRLVRHVGVEPGPVHGKNGKQHLRHRIGGYNNAARFSPWVVLVDLDNDAACAPPLVEAWLPHRAPHMCFRVVVRAIEAWLMADRQRLAAFLGVPVGRVPHDPEDVADPKDMLVTLARQSRRRDVRDDMVPRPGSGRAVGPAYTSRLVEFVAYHDAGWRPDVAAEVADSLARCLERLRQIGGAVQ